MNCRKKNGCLINTWSMQWISLICQHMQIKFQQIRKRIFHLINRRSHQTSWDFSFFLMLYKHEKNQLAGEEGGSQDSGDLSFTVRRADWGLRWTGQPDFSFWKLWRCCYHRGCAEQNLKFLLMFCKNCYQEVQESKNALYWGCWMEECFSSYLCSLSANDFEEGG